MLHPALHSPSSLASLNPIAFKCKGLQGAEGKDFPDKQLCKCGHPGAAMEAAIAPGGRPGCPGGGVPAGWRWLGLVGMAAAGPWLVCSAFPVWKNRESESARR